MVVKRLGTHAPPPTCAATSDTASAATAAASRRGLFTAGDVSVDVPRDNVLVAERSAARLRPLDG